MGGEAVANTDDVAEWESGKRMVEAALDTFGALHAVVNNAGFVRDRMFFTCSPEEWDAVIRVHLRGHFCTSRHAADYWRAQSKAGTPVDARIINTTSGAGLQGSVGQSAYSTAKAGIAGLTLVQAAELGRLGITANALAPNARTRMTDTGAFDMGAKDGAFEPVRTGEHGAAGRLSGIRTVERRDRAGLRVEGRQGVPVAGAGPTARLTTRARGSRRARWTPSSAVSSRHASRPSRSTARPDMDFARSDDQRAIQAAARDFLSQAAGADMVRAAVEGPTGFDGDLWGGFVELGFAGLMVPEMHGGLGLGAVEMALVLEELGASLAPIPFFETAVLGVVALLAGGDEAQQAAWLPRLSTGTRASFAGTADRPILTGSALTGSAGFATFAHVADVILVATQDDRIVLLDADTPGLSITPQPSLDRTRRFAALTFDCHVAPDRILARPGAADRVLTVGAGLLAAEQTGAMQFRPRCDHRLCQAARPVRPCDRLVPGGQAHARRYDAAGRGVALRRLLRRRRDRRRRRRNGGGVRGRAELRVGCVPPGRR